MLASHLQPWRAVIAGGGGGVRATRASRQTRARLAHTRRAHALNLRVVANSKLYVPAIDSGGESAETKGAQMLRRLMTHVAIRVVQGHLEGAGNDGGFAPQATNFDGTCGSPDLADLLWAMENIPLGDGDAWISAFMKKNPVVATRVLEARKAYCEEFDYDLMRVNTKTLIDSGNVKLMREHADISFTNDENVKPGNEGGAGGTDQGTGRWGNDGRSGVWGAFPEQGQ